MKKMYIRIKRLYSGGEEEVTADSSAPGMAAPDITPPWYANANNERREDAMEQGNGEKPAGTNGILARKILSAAIIDGTRESWVWNAVDQKTHRAITNGDPI